MPVPLKVGAVVDGRACGRAIVLAVHEILDLGGRVREFVYRVREANGVNEYRIAEGELTVVHGGRDPSFSLESIPIRRVRDEQNSADPIPVAVLQSLANRRAERRAALEQELQRRLEAEKELREAEERRQRAKDLAERESAEKETRVQREYRRRGLPSGCTVEHRTGGKGFVLKWRNDSLSTGDTVTFEYLVSFRVLSEAFWVPEEELVRTDEVALEVSRALKAQPGLTARQLSDMLAYSKEAIARALNFDLSRYEHDGHPPRWRLRNSTAAG